MDNIDGIQVEIKFDRSTSKKVFEAAYTDEEGNLYVEVGDTRFTYIHDFEWIKISNDTGDVFVSVKNDFLKLVGELSLLWKAVKGVYGTESTPD